MATLLRLTMVTCMLLLCFTSKAQDTKEHKEFSFVEYQIDVNGIKTAEKAALIEKDILQLQGVTTSELVFIEYHLVVKAHYEQVSPEDIKAVLAAHGAEIKALKTTFIH